MDARGRAFVRLRLGMVLWLRSLEWEQHIRQGAIASVEWLPPTQPPPAPPPARPGIPAILPARSRLAGLDIRNLDDDRAGAFRPAPHCAVPPTHICQRASRPATCRTPPTLPPPP